MESFERISEVVEEEVRQGNLSRFAAEEIKTLSAYLDPILPNSVGIEDGIFINYEDKATGVFVEVEICEAEGDLSYNLCIADAEVEQISTGTDVTRDEVLKTLDGFRSDVNKYNR